MLEADEPQKTIDALTPAGAGAVYAGDDLSEVRPALILRWIPKFGQVAKRESRS